MTEYFREPSEEVVTRLPNRPLGSFSDFVVMGLPGALTTIKEGGFPLDFHQLSDELIDGLTPSAISKAALTQDSADLALFDLLIMDNARVRTIGPNSKLTGLIDRVAEMKGRPPIITYEDLIFINPLQTDCRTHTDGDVGRSERDFYVVHRGIESHLGVIIEVLKQSIDKLFLEGVGAVEGVYRDIHSAGLRWKDINEGMDVLWKEMSPDHFSAFRPYFLEHPIRRTSNGEKYKGPSGAFTASIPIFEILFAGEKMQKEQFKYFEENEIYFPRKGREGIQEALGYLQEGRTLTQGANLVGNPPTLVEELAKFDQYLNEFRGKHYAGVRRQIPGSIEGKVSGSAGETNVGRFLRGRIIRHVDS